MVKDLFSLNGAIDKQEKTTTRHAPPVGPRRPHNTKYTRHFFIFIFFSGLDATVESHPLRPDLSTCFDILSPFPTPPPSPSISDSILSPRRLSHLCLFPPSPLRSFLVPLATLSDPSFLTHPPMDDRRDDQQTTSGVTCGSTIPKAAPSLSGISSRVFAPTSPSIASRRSTAPTSSCACSTVPCARLAAARFRPALRRPPRTR